MATESLVSTPLSRRRFLGASAGALSATLLTGMMGKAVIAQDGTSEFHSAWPYLDPGAGGHFNQFVTNGILNPPNIYGDLMFVPMGMQYWATNEWLPILAESWTFIRGDESEASPAATGDASDIANADTLQVTLRQGVLWSDGNPVTAQDVVDTFDILRLQGNTVWDYLSGIDTLDDYTLNFTMSRPSTVVERYVIRQSPFPSAIYGEWAQKARDIVSSGTSKDDPEWAQFNEQFTSFRPDTLIVNGPYTIDIPSVTNAQFDMSKNHDSYWADQAKFDKIVNFNGETDTISAVVLSKDIDYATQGFPPATEQSMIDQGIRILRPPVYNGPALLINFGKLKHFADKRVRQALAYAIDRDQAAVVSHGQSGVGVQYMTGISDNLVPSWVDEDALAQLNRYEYDPEKAAALLQEAGWAKDGDWWTDPDGNTAAYDMSFPAEYARQSAAGVNVAEQLTAFGFDITPRAVTYTQIGPDIEDGRFDFAIQTWGNSSSPHPHYSFVADFFTFNTRTDQPAKRGIDFPLQQDTDVAGAVDIDQMVVESGEGMDIEVQKQQVTRLAQVFNELLPKLQICESLGNNAALEGVRVQAWPADDDPLLRNSPYADGIPTMLIFTGGLDPVAGQ
ncbi:MAG TPA: ABC transporter substrate-binding protein [Thermomicrobiales bacterium]|nr:ABC transporter substrate-binding protein [Thermomicrobiales bacterium]